MGAWFKVVESAVRQEKRVKSASVTICTKCHMSMEFGVTKEKSGRKAVTLASPSNVTIAFKARSNIVQVLEDPSVVTVVQRC